MLTDNPFCTHESICLGRLVLFVSRTRKLFVFLTSDQSFCLADGSLSSFILFSWLCKEGHEKNHAAVITRGVTEDCVIYQRERERDESPSIITKLRDNIHALSSLFPSPKSIFAKLFRIQVFSSTSNKNNGIKVRERVLFYSKPFEKVGRNPKTLNS